jgi:2-oxoglutarate dehydrogenase E2 component (dihydrolipoamide succinyltransferase)
MATEIKAPLVGESITEITIAKWFKSDGDIVEMDEVICEMESEKATFELNAEVAGILRIKAREGDTVQVGAVICEIDESGKPESKEKKDVSAAEKTPRKPEKTGKIIEMKVPAVGESITEVTISAWLREDGDVVSLDDAIAEIESEKATFELTAEASGILHHKVKAGTNLEIGGLICTIEEFSGFPADETKEPVSSVQSGKKEPGKLEYADGHPSPAASKIMAEKGLRKEDIEGSGPGGRILKEDAIKADIQKTGQKGSPDQQPADVPSTDLLKQDFQGRSRNESRKKLSQLRKTISRRLVAVKNETAMLTTFNEVNMVAILDLRKKYKEPFKEKYGVNLGFMSFFTKACCIALQDWPSVNAKIDGDEIIYHDYCDISIAVSAPKGLVVPVIRNAESLMFYEVEKEVLDLATKARDNKLSMDEMTGGTFTITNGGVFGSMLSTPIINAPQSAILGMHNIVERPVVEAGEILIRPMMYVALSYDHRIIDGRESVGFLVQVKQLLEDPSRLLIGI